MIKRLLISLASVPMFLLASISMPVVAHAACDNSLLGLPTWHAYLEKDPNTCEITGPKADDIRFDWEKGIPLVLLALTEIALRLGSLVAVGFVIYGGFRYILSQGDPEKAKSARQTIINAMIGLVIAIAAAAIVAFIGREIG